MVRGGYRIIPPKHKKLGACPERSRRVGQPRSAKPGRPPGSLMTCVMNPQPNNGLQGSERSGRAPSHDRARSAETRDDATGEMQTQVPRLATAVPALALPGTASCTAWPSTGPTSETSFCGRYRSKFQFPHTSAGRAWKGTRKRSWTAGVERRLTFARQRSTYKICPKPSGCAPQSPSSSSRGAA